MELLVFGLRVHFTYSLNISDMRSIETLLGKNMIWVVTP